MSSVDYYRKIFLQQYDTGVWIKYINILMHRIEFVYFRPLRHSQYLKLDLTCYYRLILYMFLKSKPIDHKQNRSKCYCNIKNKLINLFQNNNLSAYVLIIYKVLMFIILSKLHFIGTIFVNK